jgi:hypothetical protein
MRSTRGTVRALPSARVIVIIMSCADFTFPAGKHLTVKISLSSMPSAVHG